MTPSLEWLPTKAKEAPSPHEVRLALLDTNPVFQSLGEKISRNFPEIFQKLPDGDTLKNIVVLLGSFHTLMNVLGTIGHLMNGSGIRNLLEVIYGENAVTHILTGKAVDRAVRSYMLLDNCLNYIIIDKILMTNPTFQ